MRVRRMREIRTSGVTREGVAGPWTRPLYSTAFALASPSGIFSPISYLLSPISYLLSPIFFPLPSNPPQTTVSPTRISLPCVIPSSNLTPSPGGISMTIVEPRWNAMSSLHWPMATGGS